MMEELSLQRNRGSCMYLERQKRAQRFTFEYPTNRINAGAHTNAINTNQTVANDVSGTRGGDGKENFRTEIRVVPGSNKTPPNVPKKSTKVLQMKMSLNPGTIAPGYSGPLRDAPYEKFNSTVIPKSYQSPWVERYSVQHVVPATETLPPPPQTPLDVTYRTFNRTPIPFGSLSIENGGEAPNIFEELQAQIEESTNVLDLMCHRPNFNRAPRGWANKYVPESPDL
ncbi:myozenin-3 isoform X2 [Hyla sarda]|nr:myozenin-3 isoform X2 [Hyla sarda]XP_056425459.1 myozenin-3 isoform X2 [Hyla sarda]